jgi:hypothetical protein
MGNTLQSQQGQQGQQGQKDKQPSLLIQNITSWYFIQRSIQAEWLLNKMFQTRHQSIHSSMQIISRRRDLLILVRANMNMLRSDLLKLVGAKMNVILALRLLMDDKRTPQIDHRFLYRMISIILSRKNIENCVVPTIILGSPEKKSPCDLITSKCHPSSKLFARMSLTDTQVFVQGQNGGNANCISVLSQKHTGYINSKCGLEWHDEKLILLVFNLADNFNSEVNLYEVSLEDRSVKCILSISILGVVFSILPHNDSFILISRDNATMIKIWRISLETMSIECVRTLSSPLYTMTVFSILPNKMIIADVSNDGLSLTISNPSGKLMCHTFSVECHGFNRVSSVLFLADNIIAIGTNCGKIKLFRLSRDYSSAECFALFEEPSDILSNGGMITYPIRDIIVHPSDPSIFAAIVKRYSVKIFKWSSDRIVVLAEINVNKDIRSIRFSTDSSLWLEYADGSVERW